MRKKFLYLPILLIVIVSACSDRIDGFREFNSKPFIQFVRTQADTTALLNSLTDSIRFYSDSATYYNVRLRIADANENLYRCQILIDSGRIQAYYKGEIMSYPSLRIDQEFVDLSLIPQQVGKNNITFKLEDKYNETSEAKLELFVFDNLLPVAAFSTDSLNSATREYSFDATASYDQDQNYGGQVVAYEWNINGFVFTTPKPIIKHVFSSAGTYLIRLRVMDNNRAYSQIVERRITI